MVSIRVFSICCSVLAGYRRFTAMTEKQDLSQMCVWAMHWFTCMQRVEVLMMLDLFLTEWRSAMLSHGM
jgi:hypothetical protein